MTTYPTLKVVKGSRSIDLNDRVNFYLRPDFVPPETSQATQIATGSALNVVGGRVVARKPQTRTWAFSVRVLGTTDAEIVNQLRGVKALLSLAGDANDPVKIQYKPNSDTPEPLWGQFGALLNYEVLDASITIGPDYMKGARRAKAVVATFSLTIQPYAVGKQQRVCTAAGGIIEDTIGVVDGRSRGVIIPEATTNLCTNPVFGNATWNTGWTAGASLIETKNTDSAYLLPFTMVSAKLTATAAANNTYTQSLTLAAVAHTIWVLIRLQDGSTPSSTQMQMYYNGAAVTTTFTSAGNGLWYAEGSVTGTAGAATCGVIVKNGYTIFLLAMQAEAKAYRTPLCFGDLLGHAWTGTVHASTSTRTAAAVNLPSTLFNVAQGCIRVAVRWQVANTHPNYMMFFDVRDAGHANVLRAYFNPTGDVLTLIDGVNFATSTAQTFSVNDVVILHFVWSAAGLVIYKNGASVASTGTYAPNVLAAKLYIGSDYASGNQALADWQGFAICDVALTATQVANDAANAAAVVADGARLESIPWLWSAAGDGVTQNCLDLTGSTGAPHTNYVVIGGVGGTAPALTEINAAVPSSAAGYFFVMGKYKAFANPLTAVIYNEKIGTVNVNSSGGGYSEYDLTASDAYISDPAFSTFTEWNNDVHFFVRLNRVAGAVATLQVKPAISLGYADMFGDIRSLTIDASMRLYYLGKVSLGSNNPIWANWVNKIVYPKVYAYKVADTIGIDFALHVPNSNVVYVPTAVNGANSLLLSNGAVQEITATYLYSYRSKLGGALDVSPDMINMLFILSAADGGAHVIGDATTTTMKVTPRYELV